MNTKKNIKKLEEIGLRPTKLRQSFLDILLKSKSPLSVTDILKKLKKYNLSPNKTSLYRDIEIMKNKNFIKEILFGENKKRYELVDKNHHHHIVCSDCGTIEDIESKTVRSTLCNYFEIMEKDLDKVEEKIEKNRKFKILNHSLEFFGICQKCA